MKNLLSDATKFRKCKEYEDVYKITLNTETKINHQLRQLKDKGFISEEEYKRLFVSGSSPSVLYGLPKVHKEGIPLRPIVAAFKTASYKIAKFIIPMFQHITHNQFTLKNSYDFKECLSNLSFPPGAVLASFDIISLFTNVPRNYKYST